MDALARRIAALNDAEDATIRGALAAELGGTPASYGRQLVRRVRHLMYSGNLSAFQHAADYGIQSAGALQYQTRGMGLEVHHLLEKRFAGILSQRESQMLSIVLTTEEHLVITNRWRAEIPYGTTAGRSPQEVLEAARRVYAEYPDILRALGL